MAPEQFQGKPSRASDQYALAVMVYEWISGMLLNTNENILSPTNVSRLELDWASSHKLFTATRLLT